MKIVLIDLISSTTIQDKVDDVTDDIHVIRSDHNEGIWENTIS